VQRPVVRASSRSGGNCTTGASGTCPLVRDTPFKPNLRVRHTRTHRTHNPIANSAPSGTVELPRRRGEIGIHAGFRCQFRKECGFESRRRHHPCGPHGRFRDTLVCVSEGLRQVRYSVCEFDTLRPPTHDPLPAVMTELINSRAGTSYLTAWRFESS